MKPKHIFKKIKIHQYISAPKRYTRGRLQGTVVAKSWWRQLLKLPSIKACFLVYGTTGPATQTRWLKPKQVN